MAVRGLSLAEIEESINLLSSYNLNVIFSWRKYAERTEAAKKRIELFKAQLRAKANTHLR